MNNAASVETSAGRLTGTCGAAAAVLIVAAPMGGERVAGVLWISGLALLVPFLAGLAATLASRPSTQRWVAGVIQAAGAVAVAVHLSIVGIAHVAGNVDESAPVHEPFHDIETALFGLSQLPFGLAMAAAAFGILGGRGPSRWLGYFSAAMAAVALISAMFIGAELVFGFLAFLLWTLVCGVTFAVSPHWAGHQAEGRSTTRQPVH